MSNKQKRTGSKVKIHIIDSAQESVLKAFGSLQRSVERAKEIQDQNNMPEISYMRPVEHDILETLRVIKYQSSTKKKEVGTFILNTNNKSLEYSTKTRLFTYKFSELGMNYKLVKKLVDTEDFRQTRFLREDINSKSNESVRKKVGEINQGVRSQFKLGKSFSLIISDPGSSAGYRINPDIKIQVID